MLVEESFDLNWLDKSEPVNKIRWTYRRQKTYIKFQYFANIYIMAVFNLMFIFQQQTIRGIIIICLLEIIWVCLDL